MGFRVTRPMPNDEICCYCNRPIQIGDVISKSRNAMHRSWYVPKYWHVDCTNVEGATARDCDKMRAELERLNEALSDLRRYVTSSKFHGPNPEDKMVNSEDIIRWIDQINAGRVYFGEE